MRAHSLTRDLVVGISVAAFIAVIVNIPLLKSVATQDELAWDDIVLESSDEFFYLTRIREVADGHPSTGNPYIFERRDQSYPLGNLWENIFSVPMTLFGWSIKTVSLLGDVLLPFLCALLAWFAFRHTLPDKRWRALVLGIVFLGMQVTLWKRPVSPQAITILPLVWLWLFLSPSHGSRKSMIARSVLIGLMAYSYPFHWTYCAAAEALLWLSSVWTDRRLSKQSLIDMFYLAVPFIVVALPWIVGTLSISDDPAYQETLMRLGLIDRRLPVGPMIQLKLLFCSAVTIFAASKQPNPWKKPILTLLAAGLAMLWLPVFTGKEAEFANHYGKILMFPMALAIVFSVAKLTATSRPATWVTTGLLTLSLFSSTLSTTLADLRVFETVRLKPTERAALNDQINLLRSLLPEQVILTENAFAQGLTVFTNHYPFAFHEAYMYLAPTAELLARAELYNTLVPDEPLSPRGVFGSQYQNRTLYAKTLCRIGNLMSAENEECAAVTVECPSCERVEHPRAFTEKEIVDALADAHVSYVFLKKVPDSLRPYLQLVGAAGGRTLYAFSALR